MKKREFIQKTVANMLPFNPKGRISPIWAYEAALDAVEYLESVGECFDPEDGSYCSPAHAHALELLKTILTDAVEKNGFAGIIYCIDEELFGTIKALVGEE